MRKGVRIWAYVVSWSGHEEDSRRIAAALIGHVDRLVVVYSNATESIESGAGEWIRVPDSHFYAEKFAATISDFDGDVMLQVHADARCDDWPGLVARCRAVFEQNPQVGIWHPLTHGASMTPDLTSFPQKLRRGTDDPQLYESFAVENVVWALTSAVCERFRGHDLAPDHFGWGVVDAVVATTHVRTLDIVRDDAVVIYHTVGTGYDTSAAESAGRSFVRQFLTPEEFRMWQLFGASIVARTEQKRIESDLLARTQELDALRHRMRHFRALRDLARSFSPRA